MPNYVDVHIGTIDAAIQRSGKDKGYLFNRYSFLRKLFEDNKNPTLKQLEDLAKALYVPFGYLLLDELPPMGSKNVSYRKITKESSTVSPNLYDLINIISRQQDWVSDFIKDHIGIKCPLFNIADSYPDMDVLVSYVRDVLQVPKHWQKDIDRTDPLKYFVDKLGNMNIFVSRSGVVGSNTHRKVTREMCRGFTLNDEYAPFIFINSNDYDNAKLFTLAHELAHVILGSNNLYNKELFNSETEEERFCDNFAGKFLLDSEVFKEFYDNDFYSTAKKLKVSPLVVAARAYNLELISDSQYWAFYNSNRQDFDPKVNESSGGNHYMSTKARLNSRFIQMVDSALKSNTILHTDAYSLTGTKGKNYDELIGRVLG
ncbi:MAG: ImmA/IrrE family metallo-endopeptidase [Candidatus Kapaibacteriales bacterium]